MKIKTDGGAVFAKRKKELAFYLSNHTLRIGYRAFDRLLQIAAAYDTDSEKALMVYTLQLY